MSSKLTIALCGVSTTTLLAGACSLWTDGAVEGGARGGAFTRQVDVTAADAGGVVEPSGDGATAAASGLPCDVDGVLASECRSCHGAKPVGNTLSLLTYRDLTGASAIDGAQTNAQRSVARMLDTSSPMPTSGVPARATTAVLERWIAAGYPMGSCGGDGGTAASDGGDAAAPACSGASWTGGDTPSPQMRPGGSCITCHAQVGGPGYSIAGTLYRVAHEPDDCNGAGITTATVVVTDANGQVVSVNANAAGNFYSSVPLVRPLRAKVVYNGLERPMVGTFTNGDCNSCHTAAGASGAPGRVLIP